jgi:DNA modification methylase
VDLPEDWLAEEKSEPADAEPQIDRAEELNKTWKVKTGDLWQIGEHRLLCGDSTKKEDVARVMGGEKAGLCFTSPPYGQQRDYDGDTKEKVSNWDGLMRGVFENLPMADDGQVLVNLGMIHREGECVPYWEGWSDWMRTQAWRRFGWYVWDQGSGLPGDWNGRLAPSHEWVFHFNRISNRPEKFIPTKPASQKKGKRDAERSRNGEFVPAMRGKDGKVKEMSSPATRGQTTKIPDSVIRITRHMGNDIARESHPATFPIELPSFIAQCWPGDIYDPFLGSGTTMVACQNLNRKCRGIEISPAYCSVILQRMQDAFPNIEIKRLP